MRDNDAIDLLTKLHSRYSWREIAEHLGVKGREVDRIRPLLSAVKRGKTGSPKVRKLLGLPPMQLAYPCPTCHKVHKQLATCEHQRNGRKHKPVIAFHMDMTKLESAAIRALIDKQCKRYGINRSEWLDKAVELMEYYPDIVSLPDGWKDNEA